MKSLFPCLILLSLLEIAMVHAQCLQDQSSLLLQLKRSLFPDPPYLGYLDRIGFPHLLSTSRLLSWNSSRDCCGWDGVTCDGVGGHVIGLDLSHEFLSGNSSGLFELVHLESLNLAYNSFNQSMPPEFEQLFMLTYLNLAHSGFTGQIPIGVSRMKRLVSLDLSTDIYSGEPSNLKLENPDLRTLVKDLSELRELYLDGVNISMNGREWCQALSSALPNLEVLSLRDCGLSGPLEDSLLKLGSLSQLRLDGNNMSAEVPEFFGNFSSLTLLHLSECGLYKSFPERIFQLPLLTSLDITYNDLLQVSLPEFPQNGSFKSLAISYTNFSKQLLPESIGSLRFLSNLELRGCGLSGPIPSFISNLTQLQHLDLSSNSFTGRIPSSLSNLTQLQYLSLSENSFTGRIPSSLSHLTQLQYLDLSENSLIGPLPSALLYLPLLQWLDLSGNQLTGQLVQFPNSSSSVLGTLILSNNMLEGTIPSSIFSLSNLQDLFLTNNNFNGTLGLHMFQNMRNLSTLRLSGNNFSIFTSGINSSLFPQVSVLHLSSCNLNVFPDFLSNQFELRYLDLSNNQIRGKIPNWIGKIGNGSLFHLNLSFNLFENPNKPLPSRYFNNLDRIFLQSNLLQGSLPILPLEASSLDYSNNNFTSFIPTNIGSHLSNAKFFSLANNNFGGEIPVSLCEGSLLNVLDLSNNSLTGQIPHCLSRISALEVLNLKSNNFYGVVPAGFPKGCSLRTLDLNMNKVEGEVSKTLANCNLLEVLDLGNNQINGTFPSWLGDLPSLRLLILHSNKLHGPIAHLKSNNTFPMFQIIDLSSNNFTGNLPFELFLRWKGMMASEDQTEEHKQQILRYDFGDGIYYQDSVAVTYKGKEFELVKILTIFTTIDLSNNQFDGEIPQVIGNLTSLYILNLSYNVLTGSIPSSFANLQNLESLDLSQNKLSGRIPTQLADLTFLSVLNLSFNKLIGEIPRGSQFQTFEKDSFKENLGLCGPPLSKSCTDNATEETSRTLTGESCKFSLFKNCEEGNAINWQLISVTLGYGVGLGLSVYLVIFWGTWNRLCITINNMILNIID